MPDNSEDEYLLEIMASHAALAFRPELPKKTVRCDCEAKVGALTAVCDEMTEEFRRSRETSRWSAALAFAAGAGVAAMFLKRKR